MIVFIIGTPCDTISVPSNGALVPPGVDPIADGATLTITCTSPYVAVGDTSSTCTSGVLGPDISMTTCG